MALSVRVKDVMEKDVKAIDAAATVADAVKLMVDSNVWSLVVVRRGLPEGVLTERDILRRCLSKGSLPDKVQVESVMSSPLITIGPDATIREAMNAMVRKNIRRLFIVEGGRITGRVTQTQLFESSLDVMSSLSSLSGQL